MNNVMNIKQIVVVVTALGFAGSIQAESLLEVYQQALQSDPRIHEAEARRLAALEAEPQARGVLLPQIGFGGNWEKLDTSGTESVADNPNPVDLIRDQEATSWGFELRQTLFRWDQIVNLRRADKTVTKAEAVREAARDL